MPTPNWSFSYAMAQTPEQNGFTRFIHEPTPSVVLTQSGTPSNRRITVDTSGGGDISFLTSNIPSLNSAIGMTAEALCNVSGPGDLGFEGTFLDLDVQLLIYATKVQLITGGGPVAEVATASNSVDTLWRLTYGNNAINVYRAGALVIGPQVPILYTSPFQRFQFFVEGGSVGIFKSMNYFLGGPVVP